MIRKRLITALTFNNGILFRTKKFNPDYRYTANFVDTWSIDEMVLLDITRPEAGKKTNFYEAVETLAAKVFVPLAVGGGVRTQEDFKKLLSIGADKVIINTIALENPEFITEMARTYGSQCVVVSMDVLKNNNGEYEVYKSFGKTPTGISAAEWAQKVESLGAGEIFLNNIEKDGSLEGYDYEMSTLVCESVNIPVVLCGGAGKWEDFYHAFTLGKAEAACTTNIYHFTESSIKAAKKYLVSRGVFTRP